MTKTCPTLSQVSTEMGDHLLCGRITIPALVGSVIDKELRPKY